MTIRGMRTGRWEGAAGARDMIAGATAETWIAQTLILLALASPRGHHPSR
jgi:hypothetical protein